MAVKLREWLARYGWAELWGLVTSYVGYFAMLQFSGSLIAAASSAAISENVGYYGCIIWRDVARRVRAGEAVSWQLARRVASDLLFEFGGPELLDSFVVRPSTTYFAAALFGNGIGVFIGKVSADLVFYVLTITLYEKRKAAGTGR